ncbi:MAG TPA: hypothetical protein VFC99_05715 [Acidimicrobiia bacterium]|nr:hypothetical protein [Acidimicrobiia bacterium]
MQSRRIIIATMLVTGFATTLTMSNAKTYQRVDFWRVWFGVPTAILLLLLLDLMGAGEIAAGIAMTTMIAAILGGKGAADFIVRTLGGAPGTQTAPAAPSPALGSSLTTTPTITPVTFAPITPIAAAG